MNRSSGSRNSRRQSTPSYGRFEPRTLLASMTGTESDDIVSITVTGATLEVDVNGTVQSLELSNDNQLNFDALGGTDSVTLVSTDGSSIELTDDTLKLGGFSVSLENVETVDVSDGDRDRILVRGTDGNDSVVFNYSDGLTAISVNGSAVEMPQTETALPLLFEGLGGDDQLYIELANVPQTPQVMLGSIESGDQIDFNWTEIEDIQLEITEGFDYFWLVSENVNDTLYIEENLLTLEGEVSTFVSDRENAFAAFWHATGENNDVKVRGTSSNDVFDINFEFGRSINVNDSSFIYVGTGNMIIDGDDGDDSILFNLDETAQDYVAEATIGPHSLDTDSHTPIVWTNVENQSAGNMDQVILLDTESDDSVIVDEEEIVWSGDDFAWTLTDNQRVEITSSGGFDSVTAFSNPGGNAVSFHWQGLATFDSDQRFLAVDFDDINIEGTGPGANVGFYGTTLAEEITLSDPAGIVQIEHHDWTPVKVSGEFDLLIDGWDDSTILDFVSARANTDLHLSKDSVVLNGTSIELVDIASVNAIGNDSFDNLTLVGTPEADLFRTGIAFDETERTNKLTGDDYEISATGFANVQVDLSEGQDRITFWGIEGEQEEISVGARDTYSLSSSNFQVDVYRGDFIATTTFLNPLTFGFSEEDKVQYSTSPDHADYVSVFIRESAGSFTREVSVYSETYVDSFFSSRRNGLEVNGITSFEFDLAGGELAPFGDVWARDRLMFDLEYANFDTVVTENYLNVANVDVTWSNIAELLVSGDGNGIVEDSGHDDLITGPENSLFLADGIFEIETIGISNGALTANYSFDQLTFVSEGGNDIANLSADIGSISMGDNQLGGLFTIRGGQQVPSRILNLNVVGLESANITSVHENDFATYHLDSQSDTLDVHVFDDRIELTSIAGGTAYSIVGMSELSIAGNTSNSLRFADETTSVTTTASAENVIFDDVDGSALASFSIADIGRIELLSNATSGPLTVTGSDEDDVLTLRETEFELVGTSYSILAQGYADSSVFGAAGSDSIIVEDDLEMSFQGNQIVFENQTSIIRTEGFESVSFDDPMDTTLFTGTDGDDTFTVEYAGSQVEISQTGVSSVVYLDPNSNLDFDGLGGSDTIVIIHDDSFVETELNAQLRPDSANILDFGSITWTSVENQIANGIDIVEMFDSAGDDLLETNGTNSHVRFSGSGFNWTLNDIGFMRTIASAGFDTANMSGSSHTMYFTLDLLTINVPSARFANIGFDDSVVEAADPTDHGTFTFSAVSNVDIEVRDDGVAFTSVESTAIVTLNGFAEVELEGNGTSRALAVDNRTNGNTTTVQHDQIRFEDVDFGVFDILPVNMSEVELNAGTNDTPLVIDGTDDDDVLTLREAEVELSSASYFVSATDYSDVSVFGAGGFNSIVLLHDIDSFMLGDELVFMDDTSVVRASMFDSVTVGGSSNIPIAGTDGDDVFTVEYTGTQAVVTQSGVSGSIAFDATENVKLNGLGGTDSVVIIHNDDFIEPILAATLGPNTADVNGFGSVVWDSIEYQFSEGIDTVTLNDSAGDDQFLIDDTNIQFSGNGFDWTIHDSDIVDVRFSTGFDTTDFPANDDSLEIDFDRFRVLANGTEVSAAGYDSVIARRTMIADSSASLAFNDESHVDVDVSTGRINFTSPTHDATIRLISIANVSILGNGSDSIHFTNNTISNGNTTFGFDQVLSIAYQATARANFGIAGVEHIELTNHANSAGLVLYGSTGDTSLDIRDDGVVFDSASRTILSNGFSSTRVEGLPEATNNAIVTGVIDEVVGRLSTLENENQSFTVLNFESIDLGTAPELPVIRATNVRDDSYVLDYTNGSGALRYEGFTTDLLIGLGNTIHLDASNNGNDVTDTLTVLAPVGSSVQLSRDSVTTSLGGAEFVSLEQVDVQGHDDEALLQVTYDANIEVFDDRISSHWAFSYFNSVTGFNNFELGSRTPTFADSRSTQNVIAGFESVEFAGTASFMLRPSSEYTVKANQNNSTVELLDSATSELLLLNGANRIVKLSGPGRSISAKDFGQVEITSNGGPDHAQIVGGGRFYTDAFVEDDGFRFFGESGSENYSVDVSGFDTVRTNDDANLPLRFHGSASDDALFVTYLPGNLYLDVDGVETRFLTQKDADLNVVGGEGTDKLTIASRYADNPQIQIDRLMTDRSSTSWLEIENIEVTGPQSENIPFQDSGLDDTFRFKDGVASMTNASATLVRATGFGSFEFNSATGNDVAFLTGADGERNTFVGASTNSQLTTPTQVVTASGFNLVSAIATGENDLAVLVGTEENEQFYGAPGIGRFVGSDFILNASGFATISAESGGGNDYTNITDTDGDDRFFARPGFGVMESDDGYSVAAMDFATVRTVSSSGMDSAEFEGSLGADRFLASGNRFGRLFGAGFNLVAVSYPKVQADGNGGADEAYLSDSTGNDSFVGSPDQSYLSGNGFKNTAVDFAEVIAFSSEGRDSAVFNGSIGNDTFYGNPTVANLSGERYFMFTSNFEVVRAFSGGGIDTATLRDSNLDDRFVSIADMASLQNDNFYNEVNGFSRVKAISIAGGDVANFEGSGRAEFFHGHRDSSYLEGDGFRNQVIGFARVTVLGLAGADVANLHDSEEDERCVARGNTAWIQGESYRIQLFDFETVSAFGFRGGVNTITIDSPDFQWERFGTWNG